MDEIKDYKKTKITANLEKWQVLALQGLEKQYPKDNFQGHLRNAVSDYVAKMTKSKK